MRLERIVAIGEGGSRGKRGGRRRTERERKEGGVIEEGRVMEEEGGRPREERV